MPDVAGSSPTEPDVLDERVGPIEQAQLDARGVRREQREVDAGAVERGAEGRRRAGRTSM